MSASAKICRPIRGRGSIGAEAEWLRPSAATHRGPAHLWGVEVRRPIGKAAV